MKKEGGITLKYTHQEYKHLIECCKGLNEKHVFHYKIFKEYALGKELSKSNMYGIKTKEFIKLAEKVNADKAVKKGL